MPMVRVPTITLTPAFLRSLERGDQNEVRVRFERPCTDYPFSYIAISACLVREGNLTNFGVTSHLWTTSTDSEDQWQVMERSRASLMLEPYTEIIGEVKDNSWGDKPMYPSIDVFGAENTHTSAGHVLNCLWTVQTGRSTDRSGKALAADLTQASQQHCIVLNRLTRSIAAAILGPEEMADFASESIIVDRTG